MTNSLSTAAKVRLALLVVLLLASAATVWAGIRNRPAPEPPPPTTPDAVVAQLKAGNERFKKSQRTKSVDTRADGDRRNELSRGQPPIAAVLWRAEGRVPPELVFDQGLGRIFGVSSVRNEVGED